MSSNPARHKRPGRDSRRMKALKARVRREEHICHLCDEPVDKALKWPHPKSASVDHIIPVQLRPDLAEVRSNLRLAHLGCNSSKGTGSRPRTSEPQPAPTTSIDW